jgi:hypothetical protein
MTEIQDRYVIVRMDPRQIRRMRDGENIRRQQIRQFHERRRRMMLAAARVKRSGHGEHFKKKQIGDNLMELARG